MLAPPVPLFYDPVRGEGFPSTCPREFFGFPFFSLGHEQFHWLQALDSTLRGKTRAIPYLSELDAILVLLWLSSKLANSAPILPWSKRTSPALREPSLLQYYFGQPVKLYSITVFYTLRKDKQPTNSDSISAQKIPFSAKYLAKTSRHSIIWRLWLFSDAATTKCLLHKYTERAKHTITKSRFLGGETLVMTLHVKVSGIWLCLCCDDWRYPGFF